MGGEIFTSQSRYDKRQRKNRLAYRVVQHPQLLYSVARPCYNNWLIHNSFGKETAWLRVNDLSEANTCPNAPVVQLNQRRNVGK